MSKKSLEVIDLFLVWSGLKINRKKAYLSIFGPGLGCPKFVDMFGIKWSTEFKLLSLNFDQWLDKMERNYLDCFDKVKKELSSWRHIFLTVFGKITVIKTMCIPKFTHIAMAIPNLYICQIKEIEREFELCGGFGGFHSSLLDLEFELFINDNNPSVTDKVTRYMCKKDRGLDMIKINHF